LKEKAKTLNELAVSSRFLFTTRPMVFDDKADKILDDDARAALAELLPVLRQVKTWHSENLSECVRAFCARGNLKLGKIAQPIRCALAGTPSAPGVFEIMALFGREETLARIGDVASAA